MEQVQITEYYDKNGICVKRTANGIDLPADTEPSVQFLMQEVASVTQKSYMSKEEFNNRFSTPEGSK